MLLRQASVFVMDGSFIVAGVAAAGALLEGAEAAWFVLMGPNVCSYNF